MFMTATRGIFKLIYKLNHSDKLSVGHEPKYMYNGGVWIRRRSDGIDVFESRKEPLLYVLHKGTPSIQL